MAAQVIEKSSLIVVEAAGVAHPYGVENRQVTDLQFRLGCQNR